MLLKVMQIFYDVEILNYFNPELQLKDTESTIKNKLSKLLTAPRGFKFVRLILVFKKIESDDKAKYDTFDSQLKAEAIINESNNNDLFEPICTNNDDLVESIYTTLISNIQKSLTKGPGWINHSVIQHNINISK